MRIARTGTAAGVLGVTVGALLLLPGCGSDGEVVPRLGVPVRETRDVKERPPSPTAATRDPGDNCYDDSYEMHGDPTPEEQMILELINRARQDPQAEAVRLNIQWQLDPDGPGGISVGDVDINENEAGYDFDMQPLPPLAMNGRLIAAARAHCWDMNDRDFFDHYTPDDPPLGPGDRISAQGYPWTACGENIAYGYSTPEAHHNAFMIDDGAGNEGRGHRENCLDYPAVKEVGIGYIDGSDGASHTYSTEDFGRRAGFDAFIVGVVYDDDNSNGFYDIGEGIGGVTVTPDSGNWHAITSTQSGGYAIPLTTSGSVNVTFTFPAPYTGYGAVKTINVDNELERKLDCTLQETGAFGDIQFSSASYDVDEDIGVGYATITVTRTGGDVGVVGVTYTASDGAVDPATAGADYAAVSSTLSWGDGDSDPKTFTVPITNDGDVEGPETVTLTLSEATGGADLGTPSTATLTILDDEDAGALSFTASAISVGEQDTVVTITVQRTLGNDGAIEVYYDTHDGSAVSSGPDPDFVETTNGMLSWGDLDMSTETFNVTITNNDLLEGSETFTVTLKNPTNDAIIISPSTITVTITDDDQPGTLAFDLVSYSDPAENDGSVTLWVSRTAGKRGTVRVDYATAGGTAESDVDFTAASDYVEWTNDDDADKPITVNITNDGLLEIDEEFTVTLSNPQNISTPGDAVTLGSPSVATVTIIDDEPDVEIPELPVFLLNGAGGGGDVEGVVTVSGTGTDDCAVKTIKILVDGVLFDTVPNVPLEQSVDFSYQLPTWGLTNGDHEIRVVVVDYDDKESVEPAVTVTVFNEIGILGANGLGGCVPGADPAAGAGMLAMAVGLLAGLLRKRR